MTDKERFSRICSLSDDSRMGQDGIGTLGEKTVHRVLKIFFEEREECREIPVGKFVADVKNESGIIEIQTSGFSALKRKLEDYLSLYDVNIVYPVISDKHVFVISRESGEIVKDYKSPRHVRPAEIFGELLYLGESITSPRLSFTLVSLAVDEITYERPEGKKRRGVSYKVDKRPRELTDIRRFSSVYEMGELFPFEDGAKLTADAVYRFLRMKGRRGSAAVKVMKQLGFLREIGKDKRKILYEFAKYPASNVD